MGTSHFSAASFSQEFFRSKYRRAETSRIAAPAETLEIISEALRWIGRLEHPETEYCRLWLLESSLFCSSPFIRDGAILGLASLNDPAAIPFIRKAIDKEPIRELQEDMKEIVSQLEICSDVIPIQED